MARIWSLQAHPSSQKEEKIRQFAHVATGEKFPTLSQKFASIFSLYDFFNAHQNVDPAALQPYITDMGKPMFSVNDIKQIQAIIKKQSSQPMTNANARLIVDRIKKNYAPALELLNAPPAKGGRRKSRRGGAVATAPTAPTVGVGTPVAPPPISLRDPSAPGYDPKDDMLGAPERPGFVDKSRNSFFDRIFLKMGNIYSNSPFALKFSHKWDGVFWFMFLLYNLENVDFFGPFLSAGLDAYILACRMAAEAVDENMPKILTIVGGILPIGVGGFGGAFLGEGLSALIGGVILMGTIIVSISRKHFGDAFKSTLDIIPVFGDYLLLLAMSAETNLDRLNVYRNKLVHQLEPISPRLYAFVDYWVPKLEPLPPGPPPPAPTIDDIKEDIVHKGMEATGANKALEKVKAVTDNPMGAVGEQLPPMPSLPAVPTMPNMPAVPTMPNMPAVPKMPNMPTSSTAEAIIAAPNGPKTSFIPTPIIKHGGGTRKKHARRYKPHKRRYTNRRR